METKYFQYYSQNTNLLPLKPKSSFRHLKQGIQEFHRQYVLVPADKAANNVCVHGSTNGTNGIPISTIGNTIGTNGNGTIGSPNGTIGTIGKPMVPFTIGYQWYHWYNYQW